MKNDEAKFLATAKEWTKKYVVSDLMAADALMTAFAGMPPALSSEARTTRTTEGCTRLY